LDLKKTYYYIICLTALFVLFWGAVDLAGATIGLTVAKSPALSAPPSYSDTSDPRNEQFLDTYYQKKMLVDRLTDGLARIVIAGLVFAFCRVKVSKLEKEK
jgi:hypothetical protein